MRPGRSPVSLLLQGNDAIADRLGCGTAHRISNGSLKPRLDPGLAADACPDGFDDLHSPAPQLGHRSMSMAKTRLGNLAQLGRSGTRGRRHLDESRLLGAGAGAVRAMKLAACCCSRRYRVVCSLPFVNAR